MQFSRQYNGLRNFITNDAVAAIIDCIRVASVIKCTHTPFRAVVLGRSLVRRANFVCAQIRCRSTNRFGFYAGAPLSPMQSSMYSLYNVYTASTCRVFFSFFFFAFSFILFFVQLLHVYLFTPTVAQSESAMERRTCTKCERAPIKIRNLLI